VSNLGIGGRLVHATEGIKFLDRCDFRLDGAAIRGTERSVDALEDAAGAAIVEIAGGKYWTIDAATRPSVSGGTGRVVTGPNKPHPITPKKPGYPLRFRIDGRWRSSYEIKHPGANPVNWPDRLGGFAERSQRVYEDEVKKAEGAARG